MKYEVGDRVYFKCFSLEGFGMVTKVVFNSDLMKEVIDVQNVQFVFMSSG